MGRVSALGDWAGSVRFIGLNHHGYRMNALQLAHAYLIGATIHTPDGNRSPTKEEVIKKIVEELNEKSPTNPPALKRIRPDDRARDRGND